MEQRAYYSIREVTEMICNERILVLSALDEYLAVLPTGNWIGGSANRIKDLTYNDQGEPLLIQVNDLTQWVRSIHINSYQSFNFDSIDTDSYSNGFSIIIIPAFSSIHLSFAIYKATISLPLKQPIIGWVAGSDCGTDAMRESVVIDGSTGEFYPERVVVMHCALQDGYKAWYDIINPFEVDYTQPRFKFQRSSFNITECSVLERGRSADLTSEEIERAKNSRITFKEYAAEHGLLLRKAFPFITEIRGEKVPLAIMLMDEGRGIVCASPTIPGLEYSVAKYATDEEFLCSTHSDTAILTIHCINTLYSAPSDIASYGEVARYLYNLVTIRLHISKALTSVFES
mgnify:CR=1 FL=1